jgi:hypothetical protein
MKLRRNDLCLCGSGYKVKQCCRGSRWRYHWSRILLALHLRKQKPVVVIGIDWARDKDSSVYTCLLDGEYKPLTKEQFKYWQKMSYIFDVVKPPFPPDCWRRREH